MRKNTASLLCGVLGLVLLLSAAATLLFGQAGFVAGKVALGLIGIVASFVLGESGGLKRFFTGRAAHFGFFTALAAILLAVVLAAANYAAIKRPRSWDLTRARVFTLSEDTLKTLRALRSDVQVLAFYGPADEAGRVATDLLKRYAAQSPHLKLELVDPYQSPEKVKRFSIVEGGPRVVMLAAGGKEEQRAKSPDEEGLTNALVRLTRAGARRLYFTSGHGEPELRAEQERSLSLAVKALEGEGFQVETLSLLEKAEVPADAAAVLVVAPRKAFLAPELAALRDWARKGGHLGLFLEPEVKAGLDPLLEEFGIALDDDMVVDPSPVAQLFGGSPVTPILKASQGHPVSRPLAQTGLAFPTARSLTLLTGRPVTAAPLALTGKDAWGETDVAGLFSGGAKRDPGEKTGPLPVAAAASRPTPEGEGRRSAEARVIVAGDGEFFDNQYAHLLGNLDFFLNAAAWLAEQEDRITIRPRSREATRLFLSAAQVSTLKFLTIDALPVVLLGLGLAVWLVRRSR